jgi:transglutaminase-like putative cysteine protease
MRGRILWIGFAVLVSGAAHAAPKARGLGFGPPPAWVEPIPVPAKAEKPQDDGNGIDELLYERQVNAVEQASYVRLARRFVTASGVERGSQLTFQWDPSYQTLTIHGVALIRGGQRIEALKPDAVKVLQRETGMEYGLFDGTLTAALVLDDVRPGDTLEYAFTRTGRNPIFAGKYLDEFGVRSSVPIERLRFRLLWPKERRLFRKAHGELPLPRMKTTGDVLELVWDVEHAAPVLVESDLPSWYEPFPWLQLTEFETWGQVARWAVPLYERGRPSSEVRALARKFAAEGKDKTARVAAALKFVQEEIRYLGLEMGTGSYRPNPPGVVLSRRFGDCKDKALLLVALLDELGVEAWPALVHTQRAGQVAAWQPSPLAFNHVIVLAKVPGGGSPWLDPTQTRQGDGLAATPPFLRALIVDPTTTALSEMTAPRRRETLVSETWEVPSLVDAAALSVTTRFLGPGADRMRASFADRHRDAMEKDMLEFYTERYPGISRAKPIEIEDDPVRNVVTLKESYTVDSFFAEQKQRRGFYASIYPQEIRDALPDPESRQRTMPLGLDYPVTVVHQAVIHLPEDWGFTPNAKNVETPYFRYKESAEVKGRVATFRHSWETLADSIPAEKVPEALAQVGTIADSLGWELTHHGIVQTEAKATGIANLNFPLAMVSLLFTGMFTGAAVKVARWQPAPAVDAIPDPALAGIRGWLVLVAIGVFIRPVGVLVQMVTLFTLAFQADKWAILTNPESGAFSPLWAPFITGELIMNLFFFVYSVLLIVLFVRRKRNFPMLFVGMLLAAVIGLTLDAGATALLPSTDAEDLQASRNVALRAAMQAAIWVPYCIRSRRVKATFVR